MEQRSNPYTPGAGAPPPALAGREVELDAFRLLIARLSEGRHENSLILYGLRGVGKTVLLAEMERIVNAASVFLGGEPLGQATPVRFDLATVDGMGRIEVLEGAFA